MKRHRLIGLAISCALASWQPAIAQPSPAAQPGAPPFRSALMAFTPRDSAGKGWQINVDGTGSGSFALNGADTPTHLQVSQPTLKLLAAGIPAVNAKHCETAAKGLANMGRKSLVYALADTTIACEYNYSDSSGLRAASDTFQAVAETMLLGAELARLRRYDRLGLDAEIDQLQVEYQDRRAIELSNIAPVLQSITDDERVMERVRRKAALLLEGLDKKSLPQE